MKNKHQKPMPPGYLDALCKLAGKGGVYVATVAHDDWCAHWQGKPCNCNPTVKTNAHRP
jgi:hypothetical protein